MDVGIMILKVLIIIYMAREIIRAINIVATSIEIRERLGDSIRVGEDEDSIKVQPMRSIIAMNIADVICKVAVFVWISFAAII
jgi:hypothetical protein